MHDPQVELPLNEDLGCEKQVVMFCDRSCKRVFDRNHNGICASLEKFLKDFGRPRTRDDLTARNHACSCLVAERSQFALDCNFHALLPDAGGDCNFFSSNNASMPLE